MHWYPIFTSWKLTIKSSGFRFGISKKTMLSVILYNYSFQRINSPNNMKSQLLSTPLYANGELMDFFQKHFWSFTAKQGGSILLTEVAGGLF